MPRAGSFLTAQDFRCCPAREDPSRRLREGPRSLVANSSHTAHPAVAKRVLHRAAQDSKLVH